MLNDDSGIYSRHQGAIVPPIFQNSLFAFDSWDSIDAAFDDPANSLIYSRINNPTALIAEQKIAELCHGEKAKLTASGMGAISAAILHYVNAGDHMITINNVYGPANNFISRYLTKKCDIKVTYIPGTEILQFEEAINDKTKLIYLESPASMTYEMQDVQAVAQLAKRHNIHTIIDNTWASPIFQKPLDYGIDIEVHSVSKYLCGHSDVIAGVIIGGAKDVDGIINNEYALLGAKIAPFEAWLILRSLRSLPIRMKQHQKNAIKVAKFLSESPLVRCVYFPGLNSSSQYELGRKQMTGYGSLMSFEIDTDDILIVKKFVDSLRLFKIGVSWGGHESLVYSPSISYVKELSPEKFKAMGIKVGLVRISVGLENSKDQIKDLKNALNKISQ